MEHTVLWRHDSKAEHKTILYLTKINSWLNSFYALDVMLVNGDIGPFLPGQSIIKVA